MLRVYVAGPWAERDKAAAVAAQIQARGHEITHDWWNYDGGEDQSEAFLRKCAYDDIFAVGDCDVLLLLNTQKRGEETSGKAVEMGMAYAWRKRILGVGIRGTNLFQYTDEVEWFPTVEEAIAAIG
jgi:hypothetical protein